MNILPKKSWHVRTKRNIERVRRDEALAAEEEKEQQRRVQLAESEARINLLREQAKLRSGGQGHSAVDGAKRESLSQEDEDERKQKEHVNFFDDVESAQRSLHGKNADHEREKKEEQETYEKKIGLLTYLGQGSSEASGSSSWYSESHEKRMELFYDAQRSTKDTKLKDSMDPLKVFKRFVDAKHGLQENSKKIKQFKELMAKPVTEHVEHRKHKHKKHKKEAKRLQKSLEQLRSERLRREQAEKARAEELLRRVRNEKDAKQAPEVIVDERLRGYNSQYNPHLAKK
ncbi:leukocyte receptor cluster member 1 homolog [Ornithodoros turicata]|uniref:leukocyte receptor cluster member 1 homolog n=1 Tax=Ornithodoros turicata TaxID=34597 RepID=UPI003139661A